MFYLNNTTVKIENPYKDVRYAEETQKLDIRFAFCIQTIPNTFCTVSNFVQCRDFLSDTLYWKRNKTYDKKIYNYSIKAEDYPLISDFIAVKARPDQLQNLQANITVGRLGRTYYYPTNDNTCGIISLARHWITNPVSISLASLLIKLLCDATVEENPIKNPRLPQKEKNYIKQIGTDFLEWLAINQTLIPKTPLDLLGTENLNDNDIHEFLGIVSMFKKYSPESNLKKEYTALKNYFQEKQKQKKEISETSKTTNNPDTTNYTAANNIFITPCFTATPATFLYQQKAAAQELQVAIQATGI